MPYADKVKQAEYQKRWSRRNKDQVRKVRNELRADGCELCPEKAPCCMAFHHIRRKTKQFCIGDSRHRSEKAIRAEAKKCRVLCHNCHAKVEAGVLKLARSKRIERFQTTFGVSSLAISLRKLPTR